MNSRQEPMHVAESERKRQRGRNFREATFRSKYIFCTLAVVQRSESLAHCEHISPGIKKKSVVYLIDFFLVIVSTYATFVSCTSFIIIRC